CVTPAPHQDAPDDAGYPRIDCAPTAAALLPVNLRMLRPADLHRRLPDREGRLAWILSSICRKKGTEFLLMAGPPLFKRRPQECKQRLILPLRETISGMTLRHDLQPSHAAISGMKQSAVCCEVVLLDKTDSQGRAEVVALGSGNRPHDADNQVGNGDDRNQESTDHDKGQNEGSDISDDGSDRPVQRLFRLSSDISVIGLHQVDNQTRDEAEKQGTDPGQQGEVLGLLTHHPNFRCLFNTHGISPLHLFVSKHHKVSEKVFQYHELAIVHSQPLTHYIRDPGLHSTLDPVLD